MIKKKNMFKILNHQSDYICCFTCNICNHGTICDDGMVCKNGTVHMQYISPSRADDWMLEREQANNKYKYFMVVDWISIRAMTH